MVDLETGMLGVVLQKGAATTLDFGTLVRRGHCARTITDVEPGAVSG